MTSTGRRTPNQLLHDWRSYLQVGMFHTITAVLKNNKKCLPVFHATMYRSIDNLFPAVRSARNFFYDGKIRNNGAMLLAVYMNYFSSIFYGQKHIPQVIEYSKIQRASCLMW